MIVLHDSRHRRRSIGCSPSRIFQGDIWQYLASTGLVARIVLLILLFFSVLFLGHHIPQVSAF